MKDFVLLPVGVGDRPPGPGPLQTDTAPYLHNSERGAKKKKKKKIRHDFAINGSEKGLEMIFDLIE